MIESVVTFLRDLRSATRSLVRSSGLTLAVVLTLALGIGANAAMFSLVPGVLLRPLVNRDENRLIYIQRSANGRNARFSVPEIEDFQLRFKTLTSFVDFSVLGFTLVELGEPRSVQGDVVGGSYFQAMGLRPVLGRRLGASDEGPKAAGAVVPTYRFWSKALNRDPSVIGIGSRLDSRSAMIVGVLEQHVPYPQMRALEIDENLADAHASLAHNKMSCDWDWSAAEREISRAEGINPNDSAVRIGHAGIYDPIGRLDDSIAELRRALDAESLSLVASAILGQALYYARRYNEAIELERKTIDLDLSYVLAHQFLGLLYEKKAIFPAAIREYQQALKASGGDARLVSSLGHAYAISRQRKLAEESLARLREQSRQRYIAPYDIPVIYAGLKGTDQTFKYLEWPMRTALSGYAACEWTRDSTPSATPHDILRRMNLTP